MMYRSILGDNMWNVETRVRYGKSLGEMKILQKIDKGKTMSNVIKHIVEGKSETVRKIKIRG
jgi:hypothetical protein